MYIPVSKGEELMKNLYFFIFLLFSISGVCGCVVPSDFQNRIKTTAVIEGSFLADGPEKAVYFEADAGDSKLNVFRIWYPEFSNTEKTYPVIIYCNGTGCKAAYYQNIFRHLATWGFIAIGTDEEMSGSGSGAVRCLEFLKKQNEDPESIFFNRVDICNVGIAGHSQGGAGVFNAVTRYSESGDFKAAFVLSGVHKALSGSGFINALYEPSLVKIPVMMTSTSNPYGWDADHPGSGKTGICNLESMEQNRAAIMQNGNIPVVIAITSDEESGHVDILWESHPYLAAWFSYWLQGNENCNFFSGEAPEILSNPRWQDITLPAE